MSEDSAEPQAPTQLRTDSGEVLPLTGRPVAVRVDDDTYLLRLDRSAGSTAPPAAAPARRRPRSLRRLWIAAAAVVVAGLAAGGVTYHVLSSQGGTAAVQPAAQAQPLATYTTPDGRFRVGIPSSWQRGSADSSVDVIATTPTAAPHCSCARSGWRTRSTRPTRARCATSSARSCTPAASTWSPTAR